MQGLAHFGRCLLLCGLAWLAGPAAAVTLVVATVDNAHMLQMQALGRDFERTHPGIRLRWVTLQESELRRYVSSSIETRAGLLDVVTVGMYEVPIWARRGWLAPIRQASARDAEDLIPSVRQGLSHQGTLYAAPIYAESSILYYRKDLFSSAGLAMPAAPSWDDVARFAAALHDPPSRVHGICLRASPGWGENITLLSTIVNSFGGQWFDMQWRPQLLSAPWREATERYVTLLQRYGPGDAAERGYNGNLSLFLAGQCAMWVDATVAASALADPEQNPNARAVGFAPAPVQRTPKGASWLWAWALAVPAGIGAERMAAAQTFVAWATSRRYIAQVAALRGWGLVPNGGRVSTFREPLFQHAAPWAALELAAIRGATPLDPTLPPSPYLGVQFAVIPEFAAIGDDVGQLVADAVRGRMAVAEALARGQRATARRMLTAKPP